MVLLWKDIPEDKRTRNSDEGWQGCHAAVPLHWMQDQPERYYRCRRPVAEGERFCWQHGGARVLPDNTIAEWPSVAGWAVGLDIDDLGLSRAVYNRLRRGGVNRVGDIVNHTPREIKRIRMIGDKSVQEIASALNGLESIRDKQLASLRKEKQRLQKQLEQVNKEIDSLQPEVH